MLIINFKFPKRKGNGKSQNVQNKGFKITGLCHFYKKLVSIRKRSQIQSLAAKENKIKEIGFKRFI